VYILTFEFNSAKFIVNYTENEVPQPQVVLAFGL